jgi:outer membrane protein OmpA-like peptidoglycan-associated protein
MSKKLFALISVVALAGCQNYSPGATEYGTLGGAAAGAGLGAIIGNQTGHAGGGVAIGSAIGALGGAIVGSQIERQDDAISERQRRIDEHEQMIRENERLIEELRAKGVDVRDTDRGVVINLPASALGTVQEIAQVLRKAPSRRLTVEGHTDSVGTIDYNHRLSEARARNVADALYSEGIAHRNITIHAYGETTPIATNRTEEGRRRNRRVEVVVKH